ncbi:MAG TPA: diguanylate cyclase [Candidatus Elarobacter sp.]|jgi:diguanylate cyclase (GGDEF)-like protein/PAS domain S-box-containing protein
MKAPAGGAGPGDELTLIAGCLERLGDAVAIVATSPDAPTRVVWVNAAFSELFGYGAEIVGESTHVLWGAHTDREGLKQLRDRMEQGGIARSNAVLYARDETPRWIELVSTPVGPDAGELHVIVYRDVTSRKMIVDALAAEKQKLETTLAAIGEAVVTTLADGVVDYINEAAETLLGVSLADVYGMPAREVLNVVDADAQSIDLTAQSDGTTLRGRALLRAPHGSADVEYVASRIGGDLGTVIVLRDVTAENRMTMRLSFEATHDPLTGLQNRRAFLERLVIAIDGARERGEHHALAFLDLDRFKIVNDRFGHAVGDRLLGEVGRLMGRVIRGGDSLARIGGDEFACLLTNCRLSDARRVAEKLRAVVDGYRIEHQGESLSIGVSIGLAAIEANAGGAAALLAEADAACYQAKAAGRNTIQG